MNLLYYYSINYPFLVASFFSLLMAPMFFALEWFKPHWFIRRSDKSVKNELKLEVSAFIGLGVISIIDPYMTPLETQVTLLQFILELFCLIMYMEFSNTFVHSLFHYNKMLYNNFHYVHHVDREPNALTTTKLHVTETGFVYFFSYFLPVYFFQPHRLSALVAVFLATFVGTLAHSGLNITIANIHRKHHQNKNQHFSAPLLALFTDF